ncbi:hypothetical protein C8R47DRAFT_1249022 [Mycena vitilis]|nr:hypothetical protein C8R47DRAFT_1249022 [Mycena vitilis]
MIGSSEFRLKSSSKVVTSSSKVASSKCYVQDVVGHGGHPPNLFRRSVPHRTRAAVRFLPTAYSNVDGVFQSSTRSGMNKERLQAVVGHGGYLPTIAVWVNSLERGNRSKVRYSSRLRKSGSRMFPFLPIYKVCPGFRIVKVDLKVDAQHEFEGCQTEVVGAENFISESPNLGEIIVIPDGCTGPRLNMEDKDLDEIRGSSRSFFAEMVVVEVQPKVYSDHHCDTATDLFVFMPPPPNPRKD